MLIKIPLLIITIFSFAACAEFTGPAVEEIIEIAAITDLETDVLAEIERVPGGIRLSTRVLIGGCTEPWNATIEHDGSHVVVTPHVRILLRDGIACPDWLHIVPYEVAIPTEGQSIEFIRLRGYHLHTHEIIEVLLPLP